LDSLEYISKRGFVLFALLAIIPVLVILVFSYNQFAQTETLRAHRIFWNDALTKVAEGTAEEAFSWFMANPENELALYINSQGGQSSIDLLSETNMKFPETIEGPQVTSCIMSVSKIENLYNTSGLPSSFSATSDGYIHPNPSDRFGILKVEAEVEYHSFSRKYEVHREVKSVNILPEIFSQFTLFIKEKRDGANNDWNQLRVDKNNILTGFADPSSSQGNPLTLIHCGEDSTRTSTMPGPDNVAPDWCPSSFDLNKRGWVFLGSTLSSGSFKSWIFHPLHGDLSAAATKPMPHRYFGGNFMLSNHTVLVYHTKMPSLSAFSPPIPATDLSTAPFDGDPDGIPFIGAMFQLSRFGFLSGDQPMMDYFGLGNLYRNYYADPEHGESVHSSLILPFGSIYPISNSTLADHRSPTIVMGPSAMGMLQTGTILQMDQDIENARIAGQDMVAAYDSQPDNEKPASVFIPYYPIKNGSLITGKPQQPAWNLNAGLGGWAEIPEKGLGNPAAYPARDWAAVSWNFVEHILGIPAYYELVMSKPLIVHIMNCYELIVNNNMKSVANPSGWIPLPASRSLNSIPATIQPVDDAGNDDGDNPDDFFFSDSGRSLSGNLISLKDLGGKKLATGYLGGLWPFSDQPLDFDGNFVFTDFDLRQKTTHFVENEAEFNSTFIKTNGSNATLDLKGGIVTLCDGDLHLENPAGSGDLTYKSGGIIIVSNGKLYIESPLVRDAPTGSSIPLTLATASEDKNVIIGTSGPVYAYIVSSGTLHKSHNSGIKIIGGLAVKYMDFDKNSSGNIFRGHPFNGADRNRIVWDEAFNCFDPAVQKAAQRIHLGPGAAIWKSEPGD
jgi:hypothetical protein